MNREQFLKALRKECRKSGWSLEVDTKLGKGSHYRITVNGRKTTVKSGELSPVFIKIIRDQLGLP